MRAKTIALATLLAAALTIAGCSGSEPPSQTRAASAQVPAPSASANLKQIQQQRAGDYEITLSNETGSLKPMMEMKGMGPMLANTKAAPSATPGRYEVMTDLSMAGPWKFMVTFAGGQAEFSLATQ